MFGIWKRLKKNEPAVAVRKPAAPGPYGSTSTAGPMAESPAPPQRGANSTKTLCVFCASSRLNHYKKFKFYEPFLSGFALYSRQRIYTDARSDTYSLGILLYEMLTGRVPFNSTSDYEIMRAQIEEPPQPPRGFAPHIPARVEQILLRALDKRPEFRFQTAGEFRAVLLDSFHPGEPPARVAPPCAEGFKQTRLAINEEGLSYGPDYPAQPMALAPTGLVQPAGDYHAAGAGPASRAGAPWIAFFRRLNWKHGVGALAVLLVLVGVPLLLFSLRPKRVTLPPSVSHPSASMPAAVSAPPAGP